MRRLHWIIGSSLLVLTSGTVNAGWNEFCNRVCTDYRRMNCWPEPFISADRAMTRAPFAAVADAGWRSEHTLGDHLFSMETQQLTTAGQIKVRDIATQPPTQRRVIFVLRGDSDDITQVRMQSIQNYLSQRSLTCGMPAILPTDLEPIGGSGDYFDQVDKKSRESLPDPRLPERQAIGGSAGS